MTIQAECERRETSPPEETHDFGGRPVYDDTHDEFISADVDLTKDWPEDTEIVDLVHLRIRSMEDLELQRFPQLKTLCLRQNLIESMSEVEVLPAATMEDIDLYDNKIKHISSSVNRLTGLKSLDLSFNKIKHIKNLDQLTELEHLYFVQNRIATVENLSTLKKLRNLELGGNQIARIEPDSFRGLENLQQIWLGKNRIPRLVNLHHLQNLRVLSIQSNQLTKIEGLEQLSNLEELYLSHNFISKIEGLEHNTKLTTLDITSNRISKVENLCHLTKLTDLWLSFNQIDQTFESLGDELRDLPDFETIYLEGNPIQTNSGTVYRRKLVLNLGPSLQKIDATYIRG
ncbi:LAME_0E08152g1_1 [Lachancea meyersii CBS 8951]|uniref:LAME_0E08152g1_1 n=1 Tax=Lachancea meyersii CBS 8951 TaxID=1266667 RepID=A0A1G4JIX2_9SACH|nr:LAME_0E08152g1_1 [Lachancea meyersii CBS 8951]